MSNNPARASQLQSSEQGACPLCQDINSKQSINCMSCGARLPWADAATAQMQASRQNTVNVTAQPSKAQSSKAQSSANQPVSNVQFGAFHDVRREETKLEKVGEFLILAFGLVVVVTLVYFVWFRALGGTTGKGFTFVPIGLIARLILNKLFDD